MHTLQSSSTILPTRGRCVVVCAIHLGVILEYKLRDLDLVGINGVIEVLNSIQIMHLVLDFRSSESEEPPGGQLWE